MPKQKRGLNPAKRRQQNKKKKTSKDTGNLKYIKWGSTGDSVPFWGEDTYTSGTSDIKIEYIESAGELKVSYT